MELWCSSVLYKSKYTNKLVSLLTHIRCIVASYCVRFHWLYKDHVEPISTARHQDRSLLYYWSLSHPHLIYTHGLHMCACDRLTQRVNRSVTDFIDALGDEEAWWMLPNWCRRTVNLRLWCDIILHRRIQFLPTKLAAAVRKCKPVPTACLLYCIDYHWDCWESWPCKWMCSTFGHKFFIKFTT